MIRTAIAVAMTLAAAPALAQSSAPQPTPAPTAAAKFSLDTPIETLMADPAAKAVVEATMPGIAAHEHYEMFKSMSFNQLAPMAGGRLTAETLAKLQAGLTAIK